VHASDSRIQGIKLRIIANIKEGSGSPYLIYTQIIRLTSFEFQKRIDRNKCFIEGLAV